MTGWFEPALLSQLLLRVIISDVFGQYADRRLIEATLDPKHTGTTYTIASAEAGEASAWIDYVADLGDGFDATYAIAYLLAQPELTIGNLKLPRGSALFLGGDEVYPTAERDAYIIKLRRPYEFAWPAADDEKSCPPSSRCRGTTIGTTALWCFLPCSAGQSERGFRQGGGSMQRRSYFSVKLTDRWWLWGIDIALIRDMDQPAGRLFRSGGRPDIPRGIQYHLCSAEPG